MTTEWEGEKEGDRTRKMKIWMQEGRRYVDTMNTGTYVTKRNQFSFNKKLSFVCYKVLFYRNERREVSARRHVAAIMRLFVDRSGPFIL